MIIMLKNIIKNQYQEIIKIEHLKTFHKLSNTIKQAEKY